ncbi:unnamed protein product, partial [marine sediment metagenome]
MGGVVCKFGGSSVADSAQIKKIKSIINLDAGRRFIVVSAPGKRKKDDKKITDLLYLCHELAEQALEIDEPFHIIRERYLEIAGELKTGLEIKK